MAKPSGTLEVRTRPPGATVFVDGRNVGKTPLSLTVTPGKRLILLRAHGERDVTEMVEVPPGVVVRLDHTFRQVGAPPPRRPAQRHPLLNTAPGEPQRYPRVRLPRPDKLVGKCDDKAMRKQRRLAHRKVLRCYAAALRESVSLRGSATISYRIDTSGHTTQIAIGEGGLDPLDSCVREGFAKLAPAPALAGCSVTQQVWFEVVHKRHQLVMKPGAWRVSDAERVRHLDLRVPPGQPDRKALRELVDRDHGLAIMWPYSCARKPAQYRNLYKYGASRATTECIERACVGRADCVEVKCTRANQRVGFAIAGGVLTVVSAESAAYAPLPKLFPGCRPGPAHVILRTPKVAMPDWELRQGLRLMQTVYEHVASTCVHRGKRPRPSELGTLTVTPSAVNVPRGASPFLRCVAKRIDAYPYKVDARVAVTLSDRLPSRLRTYLTRAEVSSGCQEDQTKASLRRHASAFEGCYMKGLSRDTLLAQTVWPRFSIDGKGRATVADFEGIDDADFRRCVRQVIERIRFPKPKGSCEVTQRLHFWRPDLYRGPAQPPKPKPPANRR